jgi:hypothetical protein
MNGYFVTDYNNYFVCRWQEARAGAVKKFCVRSKQAISRIFILLVCYWQKAVAGAINDASLFERSASLKRLDSFAYFSHQGEK